MRTKDSTDTQSQVTDTDEPINIDDIVENIFEFLPSDPDSDIPAPSALRVVFPIPTILLFPCYSVNWVKLKIIWFFDN